MPIHAGGPSPRGPCLLYPRRLLAMAAPTDGGMSHLQSDISLIS